MNMQYTGIPLVLFGIILIIFPEIIAYLLGGACIFIGVNMFFFSQKIGAFQKKHQEPYVKFGKYKIFR